MNSCPFKTLFTEYNTSYVAQSEWNAFRCKTTVLQHVCDVLDMIAPSAAQCHSETTPHPGAARVSGRSWGHLERIHRTFQHPEETQTKNKTKTAQLIPWLSGLNTDTFWTPEHLASRSRSAVRLRGGGYSKLVVKVINLDRVELEEVVKLLTE